MSKQIKIISGGQTGVDQAALRAAKRLGLATGGTMHKGFETLDGRHPEFAELYGMTECKVKGYPARTKQNAKDANVTVWVGPKGSLGWTCTKKWCPKDRFVEVATYLVPGTRFDENTLAWWCGLILAQRPESGVLTINVAGQRESSQPGIGERAEAFLVDLFTELMKGE